MDLETGIFKRFTLAEYRRHHVKKKDIQITHIHHSKDKVYLMGYEEHHSKAKS